MTSHILGSPKVRRVGGLMSVDHATSGTRKISSIPERRICVSFLSYVDDVVWPLVSFSLIIHYQPRRLTLAFSLEDGHDRNLDGCMGMHQAKSQQHSSP